MPTNSLYDATLRQQIYIEGVKKGEAGSFAELEPELIAILILLLNRYKVNSLGDLSKTRFNKFVAEFMAKAKPLIQRFNTKKFRQLYEFLKADFLISKQIYREIAGTGAKPGSAADLWASYRKTPIPGAGETTEGMMTGFLTAFVLSMRKTLTQAFAEKWTNDELTRAIFRDGKFAKFVRDFDAVYTTALQAISNYTTYFVSSLFYDVYEWVSVLDSRTTDICRSRDGKLYVYGEGPVPPAHYRCRSRIVPVKVTAPKPGINYNGSLAAIPANENTFFAWLKRQPRAVQDDMLGAWAPAFRKGKLKSDKIAGFETVKKLTIEEYRSKVDLMLTE